MVPVMAVQHQQPLPPGTVSTGGATLLDRAAAQLAGGAPQVPAAQQLQMVGAAIVHFARELNRNAVRNQLGSPFLGARCHRPGSGQSLPFRHSSGAACAPSGLGPSREESVVRERCGRPRPARLPACPAAPRACTTAATRATGPGAAPVAHRRSVGTAAEPGGHDRECGDEDAVQRRTAGAVRTPRRLQTRRSSPWQQAEHVTTPLFTPSRTSPARPQRHQV